MQWKSNTTQLQSWETTKFWCFICIMTHKERFFISTINQKIKCWSTFWACKLWILYLIPHHLIYEPPLFLLSCCAGSNRWRCLWAGNCCLDVPEVLNCASCSLPRVVWAFSDSYSLPEDCIESSEELCHELSLLSGASNIIRWISSMSVK